jgi:hypothetical protein
MTRRDLQPLDTVLGNATSTVDVLGAGLFALAINHPGIVRARAGSGVRFRLILSNPENQSVQDMIARRLLEIETADRHARLVRAAIENLKAGVEQVGADKLQVRVIDQVPPFSYFGVDTMMPEGEIRVEIYLAKAPLSSNPIFALDPARDSHWYEEFRKQFEFFWSQSNEIDIAPSSLAGDSGSPVFCRVNRSLRLGFADFMPKLTVKEPYEVSWRWFDWGIADK